MTPKERAAMQQALEALEEAYAAQFETTWFEIKPEHFTPLREALAEPDIEEMTLTQIAARHEQAEQEPVAWMDLHKELGQLRWAGEDIGWDLAIDAVRNRLEEISAAPVRTKDLTDDEIEAMVDAWMITDWGYTEFVRAVIAADREKNK